MRSFRSKPVGWQRDNYRHYLAAKYGSAKKSVLYTKSFQERKLELEKEKKAAGIDPKLDKFKGSRGSVKVELPETMQGFGRVRGAKELKEARLKKLDLYEKAIDAAYADSLRTRAEHEKRVEMAENVKHKMIIDPDLLTPAEKRAYSEGLVNSLNYESAEKKLKEMSEENVGREK